MSLALPELEQPAAAPKPDPAPAPAESAPFVAALAAAPFAFSFYQIMRLIEALHPASPRFGHSAHPAQDALRLGQEPSVTHAPSTLAGFVRGTEGRPDRLLVHFFGLFGTDGPLPLHLTEYARDRRRNHADPTFERFVNLFHHRALSLFYRAWADVRPTVSFDRPDQDRFGTYVASLIGLGAPSLRDRDAMPDLSKLHFAGLLAGQTRHAEGLASILTAFFTVPVRVESFVGAWLTMPSSDHTRLSGGAVTAGLGQSALLGARVWSRQHKFRLLFGPLTLEEYERLLPGGLSFHRLIPIVRNYAGDVLIWDCNLILKQDEVPPIRLGKQGRLGWTTWLMPRRAQTDAADLHLDASADSHAARMDDTTDKRSEQKETPL